jgi:hypothetical protein
MAALGGKVRCKMTDTTLIEVGTAVMGVIVIMSITAALAYVLIVMIEKRKG